VAVAPSLTLPGQLMMRGAAISLMMMSGTPPDPRPQLKPAELAAFSRH